MGIIFYRGASVTTHLHLRYAVSEVLDGDGTAAIKGTTFATFIKHTLYRYLSELYMIQ
jgi:hypothetical protein